MPDIASWQDLATLASRLEPSDRLRLVERIVHGLSAAGETSTTEKHRAWREIRSRVIHPACGEDAQAWVSRERRESDETRDVGTRTAPRRSTTHGPTPVESSWTPRP